MHNGDTDKVFEKLINEPIISEILTKLRAELSPEYVYHSADHSLDVMQEAIRFAVADKLDQRSLQLLALAAAYHEVGFLVQPNNNEPIAAQMALEAMNRFGGYSEAEKQFVKQMILDTELQNIAVGPAQIAKVELSKYLLDADLANLGREDFFEKMSLIQQESKLSEREILSQTLQLCLAHRWQTSVAAALLEVKKQENIRELERRLSQL